MNTTAQPETVNANVEKIHGLGDQHLSLQNMTTYTIYKITNTINGKIYIGVTQKTLDGRWKDHLKISRGNSNIKHKLYIAIREYGKHKFCIEALDHADSKDGAFSLERFYIERYNTTKDGYNTRKGGEGRLSPLSAETKDRISKAQIGKKMSSRSRALMSLAKFGDSACANNFGGYTEKGSGSPLARSYLIKFPDGSKRVICGLRAFCRDNNLTMCKLTKNGKTKGYEIVEKINDYPNNREYAQAGGNGGAPVYGA